ncbi:AMP-binding protein [Pacificibacter sp.]|uniref:class I adenylate-forming enzyme family protein n=1 Tax=Pacificibacter sp. TaxID=1917866 RepID=UPI003219E1E0
MTNKTMINGLLCNPLTPTGNEQPPFGEHKDGSWIVDQEINEVLETGLNLSQVFRDKPENYDAMIRASALTSAEREAVVCGERRINWRNFDAMITRVAHTFIEAGLAPGDRAVVLLDNRLEFLVAMLACIRAGGIAIPLGTRLGPADIDHILSDSRPILAISASEWSSKFPKTSSIKKLFLIDSDEGLSGMLESVKTLGQAPIPAIDGSDTAVIIYTSGTTGKPKGACLTHSNLVHTCLHYVYALAIDRPIKSVLAIPGTHIAGFGPLISVTLASAGTIVLMPKFSPNDLLELIETENVTYTVLVPAMYQLLVMKSAAENYDLSSWIYAIYGGSVMSPATIERFGELIPGLRMVNAYGATETTAVCTMMPPQLTEQNSSSVGLSLHCDEIKIVDQDGVELDYGEAGEIWVRGPNVSPGYWNNPAANKDAYHQGFWKTGDIGTIDADGFVYVHDRLKDMINRGGFKVFSAEVENQLLSHHAIEDCAVVGVPDPILGEKAFALISTQDETLNHEDIRDYLLRRIADYKVPDYWGISSAAIPRNANGKVQKADVRSMAMKAVERARK